ncbi:MAG: hypothetical protein MJ229_04505 [bacterium]|nr:hypothetical protein [bacterium]
MINKPVIIGVVSFLIVSAAFCCVKPPTVTRVNFSSANVSMDSVSNQSYQTVNFSNVERVNNRNMSNKNRAVQNKNLAFNTENKKIIYKNSNSVSSNGKINNQGWVSHNRTSVNSSSGVNNRGWNMQNANNINQGKLSDADTHPIRERDVDWATWRSEVVNLVLESSYQIKELEKYEVLTWFYYKFKVHADGRITDVRVYSLNMYQEDIQLVGKMIEGLAYNRVLAYPRNTKRKVVDVSALYVFDDKEKRTRPEEFNDIERYKY